MIGTAIVLLSTYMYTRQGASERPPIIRIDSLDEKQNLMVETNDASIQIPKTPLSLDDTTVTTSRPGSPSHKKRKNDSLGYFSKVHG